ncbi:MAG TPA: long-chain-fatty-acid--CoA ligase [Syntrophorhabdales bacterium]|nr:long-chain-fatty-acid--CoA ligase [Syntrophorhabdales bacterium]
MAEELLLKKLCRYRIGTWADIMYRNALLYAGEEAFVYGGERVTFAQYNGRVNSLIHALNSLGIRTGDGIGIFSWNCLEYPDVYGAAMKGGFIISPFNPRLLAGEIEYLINYSEVSVLFVGPELIETISSLKDRFPRVKHYIALESPATNMIYYPDLLASGSPEEPDVDIKEEDPFLILYTSGTTGAPRGALYTHNRIIDNALVKVSQLGIEAGDKHIMILPLFHIGGQSHFWAFYYAGGSNVIMAQRSFDPAATLKAIQDEKATDIHIVPTQLVVMLAVPSVEKYDLTSLKRIWYAASPMPVELLRKGMKKFGSIFMQGYGQSESGPDITFFNKKAHNVLDKSPREQGILASCGQPCLNVHVRIVDENDNDVPPETAGEIIVQSKKVMREYWHKPEETKETMPGGWLHTGDMGYYDRRGYIYIVDRKKDMIVTGGENVYPREVEEVLYRYPAVQEAAVIGVPDDVWVERVHAVIILKEGEQATAEDVMNFCKQNLARYKAPKSVEFVPTLPKNPQGKILKRELREKYWKGRERRVG